jgi:hypothetical protein
MHLLASSTKEFVRLWGFQAPPPLDTQQVLTLDTPGALRQPPYLIPYTAPPRSEIPGPATDVYSVKNFPIRRTSLLE